MSDVPAPLRVLLVDDDVLLLSVLRELLETFGFRVYATVSPLQALELANEVAFDILVTDVHMAEMTGPDLAETLRRRGSRLPVLFVAGSIFDDAQDARVRPRLDKPFAGLDLVEAIATVASGGAATRSLPTVHPETAANGRTV